MKKYVIISAMALGSFASQAQLTQQKLDALTAPSSPASSILGMQPTAILNPKTYQALETAIYSNVMNGGKASLPNNFALEFTPYWATNHGLKLEDYLKPKKILKDHIVRNSSFSLASSQDFALGDSSMSNAIGFGYRTTLFFGNQADVDSINAYENFINNELNTRSNIIPASYGVLQMDSTKDQFLNDIQPIIKGHFINDLKTHPDSTAAKVKNAVAIIKSLLPELKKDKSNLDDFFQKYTDAIDSVFKLKSTNEKFKSYIRHRQGLFIDMAYATFVNFPTNNFEYSIVPKQSVWVTPSYRLRIPLKSPGIGDADKYFCIRFLGVLRYQWFQLDYYKNYFPVSQVYHNNLDYGGAVAVEFNKFTFQFEAIGRTSESELPAGTGANGEALYTKQSASDFQCNGAFSYRINDQIALTYTFGKGFRPMFNAEQTLISMLSLNLGFGGPTTQNLK